MLLCLLPQALVLTPSHRDWMLQHKDLLPTLPMATLLCLLHPALVLTPSHKDLMPLHRDSLLMLPMVMVLDIMVSVMLMLTLLSCMEDMLAMVMQDIPMPME